MLTVTSPTQRYFFGQDESSHWYMVPEEWRADFEELSQTEDGWEDSRWDKFEECRLGGGIGGITFCNPKE